MDTIRFSLINLISQIVPSYVEALPRQLEEVEDKDDGQVPF